MKRRWWSLEDEFYWLRWSHNFFSSATTRLTFALVSEMQITMTFKCVDFPSNSTLIFERGPNISLFNLFFFFEVLSKGHDYQHMQSVVFMGSTVAPPPLQTHMSVLLKICCELVKCPKFHVKYNLSGGGLISHSVQSNIITQGWRSAQSFSQTWKCQRNLWNGLDLLWEWAHPQTVWGRLLSHTLSHYCHCGFTLRVMFFSVTSTGCHCWCVHTCVLWCDAIVTLMMHSSINKLK